MKATGAPARISRYEIRQELGRGTMGVVYEAQDPALGRTIALKTIQVPPAASEREREDYERRFMAEARIAARLSHAGIVVVHDVGRDPEHGILYIALEHLQGRTLAEVAASGRLGWRETLRIVGRVAEALGYAHAAGVVHRDVKPANIMLVGTGEPKIMDFGIAKLETAAHTAAGGQFFGTPLFMSPEQALGEPVDGRTDLFSLGSVAYLLLSGRAPFEGENVPGILAQVAHKQPKPLREVVPDLPPDVEYVVMRAMAKDPAQRHRDGRALSQDIEDVLAGRPPRHREGWSAPAVGTGTVASTRGDALPELSLDPAEQEPARAGRRRRRTPLLIALLVGVTGAYFYLHPADRKFWERAATEARKTRIAEEVRAWWGRVAVESPEAPAPPAAPAATIPREPPTLAASTAPPPTSLAAAVAMPANEEAVPVPAATPAPTSSLPSSPPSTPPREEAAAASAAPSREKAPPPAARAVPSPPAKSPAPKRSAAPAATATPPTAEGHLSIAFEHHLKRGRLRVWVDEARVVDEDVDSHVTRKVLLLEIRKGVVQQRIALRPGRHDVKVEVRWEDNVKTASVAGQFKPGAARELDVTVSRVGGKLVLAWK